MTTEQPGTVAINVNMLLCVPVDLELMDVIFALSQKIDPTPPEGGEESNCAKCDRKVLIGKNQQKYCSEHPDEYWVLCFTCGAGVMSAADQTENMTSVHVSAKTGERRDA